MGRKRTSSNHAWIAIDLNGFSVRECRWPITRAQSDAAWHRAIAGRNPAKQKRHRRHRRHHSARDGDGLFWAAGHRVTRVSVKQDGGGGRTRTCEAMRRLIYSQLPLPLGTLPRSTAFNPLGNRPKRPPTDQPWRGKTTKTREKGFAAGRVYRRNACTKSTNGIPQMAAKLPLSGTRDTSLP